MDWHGKSVNGPGPGKGEGQQRAILCRFIFGAWGRKDTLLLLLLLLLSSDSLDKGCGTSRELGRLPTEY